MKIVRKGGRMVINVVYGCWLTSLFKGKKSQKNGTIRKLAGSTHDGRLHIDTTKGKKNTTLFKKNPEKLMSWLRWL